MILYFVLPHGGGLKTTAVEAVCMQKLIKLIIILILYIRSRPRYIILGRVKRVGTAMFPVLVVEFPTSHLIERMNLHEIFIGFEI